MSSSDITDELKISLPANLVDLFSRYYDQVLKGCGNETCNNENCASSGRSHKLASKNAAAAKALTLLKSHAVCCVNVHENDKIQKTDDVDDQQSSTVNDVSDTKRQKSEEPATASSSDFHIVVPVDIVSSMDIDDDVPDIATKSTGTPRKTVSFLNETKLNNLISECKMANDYAPLRREIGHIFSNAESVNASFIKDVVENETEEADFTDINVDVASARKAFDNLFSIEDLPFLHALVNALLYLFENAELDLRYQHAYEKDAHYLNMFALIMEMPILSEPQFVQSSFTTMCRAVNSLPFDAQVKLVKFWSSYDADRILDIVRSVQQFITVRMLTGVYGRNYLVQNDRSITSGAYLLRLLFYASLVGGQQDSDKILTLEKETYSAYDADLPDVFRNAGEDGGGNESRSAYNDNNNSKFMRGASAARDDPFCKSLSLCWLDVRKPLVPYDEFYNETLSDNIQMDEDFKNFKNLEDAQNPFISSDENFTFMLFPFMLQPATKMQGLLYDNRIRMLTERRQAMFDMILMGNPSSPVLRIRIRRNHAVHDALAFLEIITSESPMDLKKQLFIEFENEQGVDEGGVSKEFYQLITEQLFNPDYGMFVYNDKSGLYWFNGHCLDCAAEFSLIGMLFGLAIYNNIIVDVQFPLLLYKKLMNKLGTFEDLRDFDPVLYKSLLSLLEYEGVDVEDVFGLTFRVSAKDVFGMEISHDLKEDGANLMVTKDNRQEFVELYAHYLLNKSVEQQFRAFRRGFYMVTNDSRLFWLFRPEELEQLVCGSKIFDFTSLESSADYDNGYNASHPVIKYFWLVVHEMTIEEQRQLLQFVTGYDRIPVGGMAKMRFIIARSGPDSNKLPTAHTCFNVLLLPEYSSKEKMGERLRKAISYSKGFGLI